MKVQRSMRGKGGFTLIELVISTALMSLILTSAYLCLHAGFSAQRLIEPRVDSLQAARVTLALISADLRGACPLSKDAEFIGMDRMLGDVEADNLDFATHHYTPARPGEGDYCQVSYFVERDPRSRKAVLWRRRNPAIALDPFAGGRREEIVRGVTQLKFEYYDGFDWYDSWGDKDGLNRQQTSLREHPNLFGMPEAVRITLALESGTVPAAPAASTATVDMPQPEASRTASREPDMVFQTVARLELAGRFATSSGVAGGSSSSTSPASPGASPGANPGANF